MEISIRVIKRDSLRHFEDSVAEKLEQIRTDIEPEIMRLNYEQKVSERLLKKAATDVERDNWRIQGIVYHDLLVMQEDRREELEEQIAQDRAMIAEIQRDLDESPDEEP